MNKFIILAGLTALIFLIMVLPLFLSLRREMKEYKRTTGDWWMADRLKEIDSFLVRVKPRDFHSRKAVKLRKERAELIERIQERAKSQVTA